MQRLEVSGAVRPIYESLGVKQLTDDELTTEYYQQDGATCHTSNASMREIESFFKRELSQKNFGHPDLPI